MKKFFLDASEDLNLKNPCYKKAVELYVWQAYLNDVGSEDITTELFVPNNKRIIKAEIVSNDSGILAGIQETEWFLKKLNIRIVKKMKDGQKLKKGDVIMRLSAGADKILSAERTLLNLLQRMSGVATMTNKLVMRVPKSIRILATRKTLWGDLDKRAVSVGGGGTHRLNLSDAILIKDNHIALIDSFKKLNITKSRLNNIRFIETELENLDQVNLFAKHFVKSDRYYKVAVMLDNFSLNDVIKAVKILRKTGVLIEVSGGINEKNIIKYAIDGISAISSGSITNKAPSLDFSLNILTTKRRNNESTNQHE